MRKIKRALSAAAAALVLAAAIPLNVGAVDFDYTDLAGTAITNVTFDKYLVMDQAAEVPNVTFEFTVTGGDAIPAQDADPTANPPVLSTVAIKAGIGTPTIQPVTFADGDTTSTTKKSGDDSVVLGTHDKYADKVATVVFPSTISFPEPGIYRYIITETNGGKTGITYDTSAKYLDVYIEDSNNGTNTLVFGGYVIHDSLQAPEKGTDYGTKADSYTDKKITGIQNNYSTKTLSVAKAVSGNQASRDKFFKVTVSVDGLNAGDKFTVSIASDSDDATIDGSAAATSGSTDATKTAYQGQTNTTLIEVQSGTSFSQDFYLQHGDYVAIRGLPEGAKYSVTEDAEDYKMAKDAEVGTTASPNTFDDGTLNGTAIEGTLSDNTKVGFTNTKDGTVPTGVLLSYTPAAVVGIIVIAGIIFLVRKRRAE